MLSSRTISKTKTGRRSSARQLTSRLSFIFLNPFISLALLLIGCLSHHVFIELTPQIAGFLPRLFPRWGPNALKRSSTRKESGCSVRLFHRPACRWSSNPVFTRKYTHIAIQCLPPRQIGGKQGRPIVVGLVNSSFKRPYQRTQLFIEQLPAILAKISNFILTLSAFTVFNLEPPVL